MKTFITKAPAPLWMRLPDYVPWLYVVIWDAFRIVGGLGVFTAVSGHPLGADSLLWQGANLLAAIFLIWIARWLSARLDRVGLRAVVALAVYVAVPLSNIFLAIMMLPESVVSSLTPLSAGLIALSFVSATLALTITGPAADQKARLRELDRARVEILATRRSTLDLRRSIQQALDSNIRSVVGPEVAKVIQFLKAGSFKSEVVNRLVSEIHSSVETVIKPFSRKLLADTSGFFTGTPEQIEESRGLETWQTRVSVPAAIQPFALAGVMFCFLVTIYLRNQSHPGLGLVGVGILALVVGGAIVATLQLAKLALRRSKNMHPLVAGITIFGVQFSVAMLALTLAKSFPGELFDYGTWGLPASLPNAPIFVALYTLVLSISGILVARRRDFVFERQAIEAQILAETSLLNTDVWHLRRQAALFVHGRIQAALIATGLQLQRPNLTKQDAIPLIENLEEALGGIKSSNENSLPFEDFVAQVSSLWEGVMSVNCSVSASARESIDSSNALQASLSEVVRESITNAVFHGGATAAEIRIERRLGGTLRLRVEDNGGGPEQVLTFGLGAQLFDTVTLNWKLTREGDTTVLIADFATQLSAFSASNQHKGQY